MFPGMSIALLILIPLSLILAGAWWWWRSDRAGKPGIPLPPPLAADNTSSSPAPASQAQAADDGDASPRPWLHALYAIAFDDAPLATQTPAPRDDIRLLTAAVEPLLSRIETQPRYMPRRPQLLPQLMSAVNDSESSGKAIAGIIAQDPALAGNLLKVANSALYRVQSLPVESIERAVTLIGTEGIRRIIAVALMQPVMKTDDGVFGRFPAIIWEHTLLSAMAAAEHAKNVERGDAFAAQMLGLMHGLGSIIVVQVLRDEYAKRQSLVPDAVVAAALLDQWAAPTAGRIAQGWDLSNRIAQALADQQRAEAAGDLSPLGRSLRFGRVAGALAMLRRHGRIEQAEARAVLAGFDRRGDAVVRIWERIDTP